MSAIQAAVMAVMKKAVELAPGAWLPGGKPDPLIHHNHGLIGSPVSRVDGAFKVQGKAPFAAEFALEGMVYAALAFSTIPKGRIATLDTNAAEAAAGVVLVMTHRNAPRMKPSPVFLTADKAAGADDLPIMQDDLIHWNGQPIAIVLAETQEQADHAKSLIRATYEAEPSVTDFDKAKALPLQPGVFFGEPLKKEINDAEAALTSAPYSVDETYATPRHNHNAIEPHAATLAWHGDELIVHDASQGVVHTSWSLAEVFGLKEQQVYVTSPYVGGAFGGKCLWQHQILAAAASRIVGRPVRVALSREGVYRVVGGRTTTEQRVAIGAQADGRFDALIHTGVVAMARHNNMTSGNLISISWSITPATITATCRSRRPPRKSLTAF
jgi:xanthine dehydrogenase YagR molybdenum-binding subunit